MAAGALELRLSSYSPHRPEPPQHAYLYLDELGILEALYGGAAGGGKSDALLMGALRYVDVPGYSALLLRRTYPELAQAGGLMERAEEWLGGTDARWNATEHVWTFPSGARLQFGYLASRNDRLRYQGGAYQFVGFDELTQFRELDYRYLLSRLRRPADGPLSLVPLRMRAATNPGGPGHEWVLRRFVERTPDPDDPNDTAEAAARRIFVPARLEDNPHLDQRAYRQSLAGLSRVERAQLLNGDWYADTGDTVYTRAGIRAAAELGLLLDRLAAAGELPPPADLVRLGVDFGEVTHGLLGYPLPAGGLYVVAGVELAGVELSSSSTRILELPVELPRWPGRREVRDPLLLVGDVSYDPGSAGAQSIRTLAKIARVRHRTLRTSAVPFGSYKRETIEYLRWLLEGSEAALEREPAELLAEPFLAISPRAADLLRELPAYRKAEGTGEPVKENDHGPDALVCLAADAARRHRDRGLEERARLTRRAAAIRRLPGV